MNVIKKIGFVLGMLLMMNLCMSSLLSQYGTVSSSFTVVSGLDEGCEYYDTFSSETLDMNKWSEFVLTMSEHHIEDDVYHVAQTSVCGGRKIVLLTMNRTFESGDSVEYDINYVSGYNNSVSTMMLIPKNTTLNMNNINGHIISNIDDYNSTLIGYLNGVYEEGNNDYGSYHMKLNFSDEGMYSELTKPDYSTYTHFWDGYVAEEHIFSVVTFVRPNSLIDIDYDNFVICKD